MSTTKQTEQAGTAAIPKGHYTFAVFRNGAWQFPLRTYYDIAECKKHARKHNAVVLKATYEAVI